MTRQTLLAEPIMGEIKKADCTSVENALKLTGVSRNTLNTYINALGVSKHKFPFDRRVYITNDDLTRIQGFMAENRGDEE